MENYIRDKGSSQVAAVPGVEEGHVEDHNRRAFLLRDHAPLVEDFIVVPSQAVDAFDDDRVAGGQLFQELAVGRPLKVLSGLFVEEDVVISDAEVVKCDQLSRLVLLAGADPDVAPSLAAAVLVAAVVAGREFVVFHSMFAS